MIIFQNFLLAITIPVDSTYSTVMELLRTTSYQKQYQHAASGPDRVTYVIGPLKEIGVNNWKMAFKEIFKDSPYRTNCEFVVTQIGDY